jgi:3-polyprenyl-4-hydroxybenzoate decarboxylase
MYNVRASLRQRNPGEARNAIAAVFGSSADVKHVFVVDEDIDVFSDEQIDWALATRFQADRDIVIASGFRCVPLDPSLQGSRTGAKAGFDCTKPFGREGQIPLTRSAAKVFKGPARFQTVEQALGSGPMFYADIVEQLGSTDGREVAVAIDGLREQGKLGRDRDGRYHLVSGKPGITNIVGELYHDPNEGA